MNICEIDKEIKELERYGDNWLSLEKLSILYIIKSHYKGNVSGGGTLHDVVDKIGYDKFVEIIDEHLQKIKFAMPEEYGRVMYALKGCEQ